MNPSRGEVGRHAVVLANAEGLVVGWPKSASDVFGYASVEILGKPLAFLRPAGAEYEELVTDLRALALRDESAADEGWWRRQDGERFLGLGVLYAHRDVRGGVIGLTQMVHDLRDWQEREGQFGRDLRLAQASVQQQERLMDRAVHQLRTPLSGIALSSNLLARLCEPENPQASSALEAIRICLQEARAILQDLADLGRIDDGTFDVVRAHQNLAALTRAESGKWVQPARDSQIVFGSQVPDDLGQVLVDAVQWQRLIQILLSNSMRATQPGGTVHLSVRRDGPDIRLEVADTGLGLEEPQTEQLFQRPSLSSGRGDGADARMGVGLWIARAIVERHGGTISARSEGAHQGTRVSATFHFPINEQ